MLKSGIHATCSSNWNAAVELSNPAQIPSDRTNVAVDAQRAVYCTQPVEVQDGGKVTIYEGGLTIEVLDEGAVRADVYQEEPTLLVASVQDDESSSVFGGGATPGIKRFADCVARLEAHAKLEEQLTGNEKADKKARRKTQWKPCRCGSHSHRRTNHSDCPLNKKKSLA